MPSTFTDRLRGLTTSVAVKAPVLCASTANLTLSSTQVIDGVTVSTGDRVLVKDQTGSTNNGIYIVDSASWSRSADADGTRDLVIGTMVYVTTGSTANTNFQRFFEFTSTSSTSNIISPGIDAMTISANTALAVSSGVTVTAFAETFLDDVASTDVHATLGLEIGTDVQAFDQQLADLAATTPSTGGILYYGGANGSSLVVLAKGSSGTFLVIGSSVPSWSADPSTAIAATQAEMEVGTATTSFVTPGVTNNHPGVAKVVCKWEQTGAHGILASHNMTSVTDGGAAGDTDHLWNVDFSSVDYSLVTTSANNTTPNPQTATFLAGGVTTITASQDTNSAADSAHNMMAIFGDQA